MKINNTDAEYLRVLKNLYNLNLRGKQPKGDRTGTGTISYFGEQIKFSMREGFPILTSKSVWFSGVKTELLWFMGNHLKDERYSKFDRTNIRYLLDHKNRIWSEWPFKKYLEKNNLPIPEVNSDEWNSQLREWEKKVQTDDSFCEQWGNLGPVYGKQWMSWGRYEYVVDSLLSSGIQEVEPINQLQNAIDTLKTNPDSRRILVNAWNPSEIDDMALPPCHLFYQFYSEELSLQERAAIYYSRDNHDIKDLPEDTDFWEGVFDKENLPKRKLSLQWYQRSCDYFLGIPFNITSYALLLTLVAREVNMVPDLLVGSLGDTHLYLNHLDQAKEQLSRLDIPNLPTIQINENVESIFDLKPSDIELQDYEPLKKISAPISV